MSETQLVVLALVALLVTVPTVRFTPRARQSRWFDRVLWVATWSLAFIGAWYAVGQLEVATPLATLSWDAFARAAGVPIVLGALSGALVLNLALWLMDRVTPPVVEELSTEVEDANHADDAATQASSSDR